MDNSHIIIVPIEFEVGFHPSFRDRPYISRIDCMIHANEKEKDQITFDTWNMLRDTLTTEDYMRESVVKKLEFEVLVDYYEKEGQRIPVNATCQTICPALRSWVEQEAMKQVKGEEGK
jgi:hypothetical protein